MRRSRPTNPAPRFARLRPASPKASRIAASVSNKRGSTCELKLGSSLRKLGLRFRTNVSSLPGCPDLVFDGVLLVVFVDGDFWHGRDWPALHARLEKRANPGYWIPKIARNIERDAEQTAALENAGWRVLRFWETDVLRDPLAAATAVETVVRGHAHEAPVL